jgi:hypothetical protein
MTRLLRAMALGAAISLFAPLAAQAAATLYAGPPTDPVFTVIAPRVLSALFPEQRLDAASANGSMAALERVVADPTSAALADLASMLDFISSKKLPTDRLEFHGPVGARCMLGFARRDGWVHGLSDVIAANGTPRPTVGLAGPDAAQLFGMLRRVEPGLSSVETQAGTPDELAAQVGRGAPDLLLLVAEPDLDHALIQRLAEDDRLVALPVVSRLLSRAAVDRNSGFTMQPVRTDSGLMPWSRRPVDTLCTPIGIVLRGDAPAGLRDAVGRATPVVAAALRQSLTDRAGSAANNALHDTVDTVQSLWNRLHSN